jgi:hypothetical protein
MAAREIIFKGDMLLAGPGMFMRPPDKRARKPAYPVV